MQFDQNATMFRESPYEYLAGLRDSGCTRAVGGGKVFFDYTSVDAIMSDPSLSVAYIPTQMEKLAKKPVPNLRSLGQYAIVFTDPPLHHRLRKLHMVAFNKKAVAQYDTYISEEIKAIFDGLSGQVRIDVVSDIADVVPKHVLTRLLGIEERYREEICTALMKVRALLEPTTITPRMLNRLEDEFTHCVEIFRQAIVAKRQCPCDDIISTLLNVEKSGECMSDEEIVISCALTYIAGHETTKSLISSGMKLFQEHPAQWQTLADKPALLDQALEEIARFEPPLHFTTRVATKDFAIQDVEIHQGEMVLLCIASANRDPRIFNRPDSFDITRVPQRNLAFGSGMHNCIGKVLALTELKTVFNELLAREIPLYEKQRLATDWLRAGPTTRSLAKLELSWA